jgi:hypothetical protein
MSDKKISALTSATTPLAGTEVLPIVQGGETRKVSVDNLTAGKPVSIGNLTYTGTLTGSTGVLNIGSGQMYKGASGDVGISTASPQTRLHLGDVSDKAIRIDTGLSNAAFYSGWQNTAQIGINRNPATGVFADSAKAAAAIRLSGDNGNSFIALETTSVNNTAPSQRLLVNNTGDVSIVTGNLVISTSGKGIDFSATPGTGTSELFADYEEGTFSPTVTAGSGSITSFTLGVCNYTKVGRTVTVNVFITITNAGTGAGALVVSLPFTNGATTASGAGRETTLTGNMLQANTISAASTMSIFTYANLTTIATNAVIVVTIKYFV